MTCVPMIPLKAPAETEFFFSMFHLAEETEVDQRLAPQLKRFPIQKNGGTELRMVCTMDSSAAEGAYALEISPERISVTAATVDGLYYGMTALSQMYYAGKGTLPLGRWNQSPKFRERGIMLDVSRGKMANLDYLKHLVAWMSGIGYTVLQLYCEDKLCLSKHPEVGMLTGAYTEAQIRELDAYCTQHFVDLQPCIQTYSHVHGILRTPENCHLAENDTLFSFAAGKDEVYQFLEDEFSEILPWFSSKTVNINMDEAYDLGTGYTKEAVEKQGKGNVFVDHILRVIEIVRSHGAERVMLWGDVTNKYPELLSKLPENVVIAEWNYNPQETYPTLLNYRGKDIPFWAAGGVSTWNSLFPRVYNSYINLIGLAVEAEECGAEGFLVTDWGDYGHMQPLGMSLYGYLLGAEQAWNAARIDPAAFEACAWKLVFQDERVQKAFRHLMDSNLAPNIKNGFKTMTVYYFFDDMLAGLGMKGSDHYHKISGEAFAHLYAEGTAARALLEEVLSEGTYDQREFVDEHWKALFGSSFLKELHLSARMTEFIGEKGKLAYQIREMLANPGTTERDILGVVRQIHQLYAEFIRIRQEFGEVWMLRSEWTGIETVQSLFDKAGLQMAQTVSWLAEQRQNLLQGKPLDAALETYTCVDGYGVLWTGNFKNMWDRAYPWQ